MKPVLLATAFAVLAVPAPSAANGPAIRFQENVVGEVLVCPGRTYTVTGGIVEGVLHEGESASDNTNFTVTIRPRLVLVDEHGNVYSMRGATWFGGAENVTAGTTVITATHNLEIVSRGGGVVDSIKLIERFRNGELTAFEFGTCSL